MKFNMNLLLSVIIFLNYCAFITTAAQISAVYQPKLKISLDRYRKTPYLMRQMEDCILRDGRCDSPGRWLKARIITKFAEGRCVLCTPQQSQELDRIVAYLKNERSDLHGSAMQKYMEHMSQSGSAVNANALQGLFSNFLNK